MISKTGLIDKLNLLIFKINYDKSDNIQTHFLFFILQYFVIILISKIKE
jgi:hypothetical protein